MSNCQDQWINLLDTYEAEMTAYLDTVLGTTTAAAHS